MGILKFSLIALVLVFLIRRKFDLGLSLIFSALLFLVLYWMNPVDFALAFRKEDLIMGFLLLFAVMMIINLSELMKRAGRIGTMVGSLRTMLGDPRGVVTLVPAMIGLLPIIGGAMISAPMVEEASEELELSAPRKTFLNYWFRHLWEYIFPTYPGVIFSAAILGITFTDVAVANMPLSFAAIAAGLYFGLKGVNYKRADGDGEITGKLVGDFITSSMPLIIVITAVLIFKTESIILSLLVLVTSLLVVFFTSALLYRIGFAELWEIIKSNFSWKFVSIVVGVLIFKEVLEVTDAATEIATDMERLGIPVLLVLMVLPFIIGISTGITMAYVSITFPILLPFFNASEFPMVAYMLAYAGGYAGVMLSPVHLCLVLTAEYFKADLGAVYREVVAPMAAVLLVAVAAFLVLNVFL
jgi:integral membrane protein (TIGR00529 family)